MKILLDKGVGGGYIENDFQNHATEVDRVRLITAILLSLLLVPALSLAQPQTLTVAFLPQENPERLLPNAKVLSEFLSQQLGMPVKTYIPTDYAAVVEALRAGHAQVALLSAWPYLLASRLGGARIILAEVRRGKTYYYSQWYTTVDSGVNRLSDLRGKAVAFTSPSSTSGYLFPMARLVEEGLLSQGADPKAFFKEALFAGGYEQALKALARGQVVAAAASDYAFGLYLSPEEQKRIKVITRQGPVPTHGVAVRGDLPSDLVERIKEAFLKLNRPENLKVLKQLYGAEALVEVTHDQHVSALQKAADLTGFQFPMAKR